MLLASRTAVGSPQAGVGYELDAIASCVIGGVSLTGGIGSVYGSLLGVLFIAVMGNGMDMLGITSYYQSITKGIIIILAVLYDMKSRKASK
jgi:ribose/xylose/arabinose/galactoside ABC-type transport system permease subunit